MKQLFRSAMIAAMLVMISACATVRPDTKAAASDIARTSWCLGDSALPIRAAPAADYDDRGNRYDPDVTTDEKLEHNARYHGACS